MELLLNLIAESSRREKEFVDGLSDAERAAEGLPDNWSAKDVLAHCAHWKRRRVAEIPKVLQGGTPEEIAGGGTPTARFIKEALEGLP